MTRCLDAYTLFLLYTGEGTEQQWAHLSRCPACIARYQQLRRDMERMERILRVAPPPRSFPLQPMPRFSHWLPALAAVAAALLLVLWGRIHGRDSADPVLAAKPQPQQEAPARFVERERAPALLSVDEVDEEEEGEDEEGVENPTPESAVVAMVVPVSSAAYVQAALEGGWPCEWQAPLQTAGCELPLFPLGLGEL